MNERLRTVMLRQGIGTDELAEEVGVDPKTVERWITMKRTPHRRHRWVACRLLGADESYLWPDVTAKFDHGGAGNPEASKSELIEVHPDRSLVPREKWMRLLTESQSNIDVLFYSGTFFAQIQPRVACMLAARAEAGVEIRLCFGDPSSSAVNIRDAEERLGGTMPAKIRASLTYYREIATTEGIQIRLHGTTLYNSLFRYDDEILVNSHAYGEPASLNPTLHYRKSRRR